MRKVLLLAAAILLLAGVAVLAVWLPTRDPAGPAEAPEPPASPPTPAAAPPVPPATAGLAPAPAAGPPAPMQYAPLARAPAGSWEAVRPVARAVGLGRLGLPVQRGLQALQPGLSACFDEEAQARHGQTGYTAAKEEYAVLDETGQTVLMLQLEVADGKVRIVDAPLEARGGASDGLVACAQQVLRGQSFAAPGAAPGRHRLLFPLLQ